MISLNINKESNFVKSHWENMSKKFGIDLKSTTKTITIKKLEINALSQAINYIIGQNLKVKNILEFGCGNGYNCFALSREFRNIDFTGVDYVQDMVNNAKTIAETEGCENIRYMVGDILEIDKIELFPAYDIVFTDRCIINLDSVEKQKKAICQLVSKIADGGYLILIENILQTYNKQNSCRKLMGLEERIPAPYNLFLDDNFVIECAKELALQLVNIHDFGSLHDLFLYVILPKMNDSTINYDDPIVDAITDFCINTTELTKNQFGEFGQNRLYLFKKGC